MSLLDMGQDDDGRRGWPKASMVRGRDIVEVQTEDVAERMSIRGEQPVRVGETIALTEAAWEALRARGRRARRRYLGVDPEHAIEVRGERDRRGARR